MLLRWSPRDRRAYLGFGKRLTGLRRQAGDLAQFQCVFHVPMAGIETRPRLDLSQELDHHAIPGHPAKRAQGTRGHSHRQTCWIRRMSSCLSIHAEAESSRARMQARATPPVSIQGRSAGVEQPELDGAGRYHGQHLVVFSSLRPADAGRPTDRQMRHVTRRHLQHHIVSCRIAFPAKLTPRMPEPRLTPARPAKSQSVPIEGSG
ncbi:hypothetical protein V8C42DRAFT_129127 [Trichoderma barbatum]